MMKVNLGKVDAHVAFHVGIDGSVLAQTVRVRTDKIEVHYNVESTDDPEKVEGLMRNARNGCFVRQTIGRPEIIHDTINLNGQPFKIDDYPPPAR